MYLLYNFFIHDIIVQISRANNTKQHTKEIPMAYIGVHLENSISIDELYTVHYFEYMSTFSFAGESHDFWEFLYVDKGEIHVTADSLRTTLKKGDIILFPKVISPVSESHKSAFAQSTVPMSSSLQYTRLPSKSLRGSVTL